MPESSEVRSRYVTPPIVASVVNRPFAMITLINPPGIKTFSGLQMHTPNPPLGLAYIAAAVRDAGFDYQVIDATGSALDAVSPYPDRPDFMVQGLTPDEIVGKNACG